jgi:hypothetical protein
MRGIWGGVGKRGDQFASNLGLRWTDPVTARRVPNKWRERKGSKRDKEKEHRKQEHCS